MSDSTIQPPGRIQYLVGGIVLVLFALAVHWAFPPSVPGSIQAIQDREKLVVLTVEGPTTLQRSREGPVGYEVDLATAFAESLGAKPEFVVYDTLDDLMTGIAAGRGHIAAANLTITDNRQAMLTFGPAYKSVSEQLVCHRDFDSPETIDELGEANLIVLAGSSYVQTVNTLQEQVGEVKWEPALAGSAMPVLAQVDGTENECTIADSHLVSYARRQYPELAIAMTLSEERSLAWAINPHISGLERSLEDWFANAHETGLLRQLDESWFGHFDEFDYVDVSRFMRRVETTLPEYRPLFEAAAEPPFGWPLLAAQAYQESHWNPNARSATGVRGLMMLTLNTARELDIENRLDPEQSIKGGAAYLKKLYDRLPDTIREEEKVWFALAAYNVGYGHLRDARTLARREGLNPDVWSDVALMLPRLSDPEYYKTVRHGYARGNEPVRYVQKVREYEAILSEMMRQT